MIKNLGRSIRRDFETISTPGIIVFTVVLILILWLL